MWQLYEVNGQGTRWERIVDDSGSDVLQRFQTGANDLVHGAQVFQDWLAYETANGNPQTDGGHMPPENQAYNHG